MTIFSTVDLVNSAAVPIEIRRGLNPTVLWRQFPSRALSEPTFRRSLTLDRAIRPNTVEHETRLEPLLEIAADRRGRSPGGFIFHISRCGSTLMASALRASGLFTIVAEADPINKMLLTSTKWSGDIHKALIKGTIQAFVEPLSTPTVPLIIKFSSWNVFSLNLIRDIWPSVPWIFIFRDPAAVIDSNLHDPSGWMRAQICPGLCQGYGVPIPHPQTLSREDYAGKVVGSMFARASDHLQTAREVIEYPRLGIHQVREVARAFGGEWTRSDEAAVARVFEFDAKNPLETWKPDLRAKRPISLSASNAAVRWSSRGYNRVRKTMTR
jgi:hypothetical protein